MPALTRSWHHAILTTYGAWLHGDARGFRTRHQREHIEGDYKTPPPVGKYVRRERRSRESLVQDPVVVPQKMRRPIGESLQEKIARLGGWVLCLAVSGQHVHMLVKLPPKSARRWIGQAKKHTTFLMRERGWQGKLWGVRAKVILVRSRHQQVNTYRYILRHAREGAWVGVWKIDGGEMEA